MHTSRSFFQRIAYRSAEYLFRFAAPAHAALQHGDVALTRSVSSFTARERRYLQPKRRRVLYAVQRAPEVSSVVALASLA